jgi:hypothetical protein
MSSRDESVSLVVVELSDATWHYVDHQGGYLAAEADGSGDVTIEVGYTGISEEGAHSAILPRQVVNSLLRWLR